MSLFDWAERKIRGLHIWEFALVKLVLVLFGIIVGAYLALFVKQYLWWFVTVFVMLYLVVMWRVFGK